MDAPEPRAPRLRELGLQIGDLPAGPANAISDVPGIALGHVTVWREEPEPPQGRGIARTGVTAVVPGGGALVAPPLAAGTAVLNGAGELTGALQIHEWGVLETPVFLTSTMAVGRVFDGAVSAACAADPAVGLERVVIPVVGECDDSWLSEARVVQIEADDVGRALAAAGSGRVHEGCVGAGAGMVCMGWKGGIGTSSRRLPESGTTLGVLVLANFGAAGELRLAGLPVAGPGECADPPPPGGSCVAVVATDAPLGTHALARIARRCGLGLARTGSVAHHGSGEIFLALATSRARREPAEAELDELFAATVDATEEAVLNALWAAVDTTGREGRLVRALPHEPVLALLEERGLLHYGAESASP
jgi:D-aminopeptidase